MSEKNNMSADGSSSKIVDAQSREDARQTVHRARTKGSALPMTFSILALLLSLAASGVAAYTWYVQQVSQVQSESRLVSDVAAIGSEISVIGERVQQLQSNRDNMVSRAELDTRLMKSSADLDQQVAQLTQAQDKALQNLQLLQDDVAQGVNQFIIDDVGQLLKAASNSAAINGDRRAALTALNIASKQQGDLDDPRFTTVRQQVLEDIQTLEAVSLPDYDKLSLDFSELANSIAELPLENEPPVRDQVVVAAEMDEIAESGFTAGLREMGRDFLSIFSVRVQKYDTPPKPLLAPEQRYFLDQNVVLALNKAELAALQRRPVVYSQSLKGATELLSAYYDLNDKDVQAVIDSISSLSNVDINNALPSITASYTEFVNARGVK